MLTDLCNCFAQSTLQHFCLTNLGCLVFMNFSLIANNCHWTQNYMKCPTRSQCDLNMSQSRDYNWFQFQKKRVIFQNEITRACVTMRKGESKFICITLTNLNMILLNIEICGNCFKWISHKNKAFGTSISLSRAW